MRILLDECVNPRLKLAFPDHEVKTAVEMGWSGLKNGELLAFTEQEFDVFLTLDQNLEFQQNTPQLKCDVMIVRVPTNKISSYEPVFDELNRQALNLSPGKVCRVISSEFE